MKRNVLAMIAVAMLALVAGATLAQADAQEGGGDVESYLTATVFPGSVLLSQNTETEFESSASLQEVYTYIHERLLEFDWERSSLTENEGEIEALYTRNEQDLEIDLEQETENRFDLETSFDD